MRVLIILMVLVCCGCSHKSWRETSRESVGIAVRAELLKEDIFQIYYARAFSWRGYFGIHPWMAWKSVDDDQYTVAHVTSWQLRRGGDSSISVEQDLPDRKWYDRDPTLMFEVRGEKANVIIEKVKKLIATYPYKDRYTVWPGPNSNTFVSYMIRNIEELDMELPAHAVGKDYLAPGEFLTKSPSATGFQVSAYGVAGLTVGMGEGFEVNILGLSFGVDLLNPALKLPVVGRLGFSDYSNYDVR